MSKSFMIAGTFLFAVASLSAAWALGARSGPDQRTKATHSDGRRTTPESQSMSQSGALLEALVAAATAHSQAVAPEDSAPNPSTSLDVPEPYVPEQESTPEETFAQTETEFQEREPDFVTARKREAALTADLQGVVDDAATVERVECRTDACRVYFRHRTQDDARRYVESLFEDTKWTGAQRIVPFSPTSGQGFGFSIYFYQR